MAANNIPGITVRVIEYGVSAQEAGGDPTAPPGELYCLATTLLGHQAYPVEEFPDRYAERWEVEAASGVVETRLRDGPEVVLRSKSPDLVRGRATPCCVSTRRSDI